MHVLHDVLARGLEIGDEGTRSETAWKSSRVSSMPQALGHGQEWRTALVEPPSAMTMSIAFSKAARVMISLAGSISV